MMEPAFIIPALAGAYVLGSVPNAVWIGKSFFGVDVREHGSGNAGATNTLRVLGKKAGISVLFLDFLKGYAAASLAWLQHDALPGTPGFRSIQMLLGVFAVLGHVYPVFARFKGGKGIATMLGVMVAISWQVSLICTVLFVLTVWLTRYVSLGSMIGCVASPVAVWLLYGTDDKNFLYFCAGIAVLSLYTHRANINRLMAGTETRFSFGKKPEISNTK